MLCGTVVQSAVCHVSVLVTQQCSAERILPVHLQLMYIVKHRAQYILPGMHSS